MTATARDPQFLPMRGRETGRSGASRAQDARAQTNPHRGPAAGLSACSPVEQDSRRIQDGLTNPAGWSVAKANFFFP